MSFISRAAGLSFLALAECLLPLAAPAQAPQLINYQGRLLNGTNLVNGNVGLSLRLFDAPAGGTLLYEDSNTVTVADGLYSTFIGDDTVAGDLGAALDAPAVYVEVSVSGVPLSPRERIVSSGYALHAWGLSGNAGTTAGSHFIGTSDNQPLDVRVNNARALRIEPASRGSVNFIAGAPGNSVATGVTGAVIGGGGTTNQNFFFFTFAHSIAADFCTIGGGEYSLIQSGANNSVIGGGSGNQVEPNSSNAVIAGGVVNLIRSNSYDATIGGGRQNAIQPSSPRATIAGGANNAINFFSSDSAIGGGWQNTINEWSLRSVIGGGYLNKIGTISGAGHCTIAGGRENVIRSSDENTIGGGYGNIAGSGAANTVAGGSQNNAEGSFASVPGGRNNWAKGDYSFAAGRQAKAQGFGAFVWADGQAADFSPATANEVSFRCQNGVTFSSDSAYTQTAHWTPGSASWSFTSDRNTKEAIAPVDTQQVLDKVARLPISEWQYKGYAQRHIGPMAQDFHAEFPLNDNDRVLNEADLHGVALAAIQALAKENAELKARLEVLERRLDGASAP